MVRSGFQNFCFRNQLVSKMLEAAYGLSRELRVGCFCVVLIKARLSGLSPEYFMVGNG